MRTCVLVVLSICLGSVEAQELEFGGYYENHFFPQELDGRLILQDYNQVRIDLSADAGENVSFSGDYIYRVYHGARAFNAFDFVPERVVSAFADEAQTPVDALRPLFAFEIPDENFLDNAYVTLYFKRVTVRVGKQQLPWGAGYAWNPTDIFNAKDLLDPTYEKVGVDAFKLEAPFGREGMVTGILGVGEDWRRTTKALKVKQHDAGFDVSLSFVEKIQEGHDYTSGQPTSERRRLFGGDFSGELFGLGVWGEGAYNTMADAGDFGQYLAGVDYTFENGLYLTGEYYRNGSGKTGKNGYTFQDWMRLLDADGENLGRDYVYFGERYAVTELLDWSNYLLVNLNDGSGLFFPWLNYSLNDNTEVIFAGYIPFGRAETEFGGFGVGGFVRVRVYF